jgi:hypothetical protein
MHDFKALRDGILTVFAVLGAGALAAGCGTYGDPCLRITDCGSGLTCVEGKCVIDVGDTPRDGALPSDAPVSGDASVSDGPARDVATDSASEEGSAPPLDSSPADALRDGADGAETALADTARADATSDIADVRATDIGSSDAMSGDVGEDAASDSARDALMAADALDAAG